MAAVEKGEEFCWAKALVSESREMGVCKENCLLVNYKESIHFFLSQGLPIAPAGTSSVDQDGLDLTEIHMSLPPT